LSGCKRKAAIRILRVASLEKTSSIIDSVMILNSEMGLREREEEKSEGWLQCSRVVVV
jgi:hypothetical protein